MNREQLIAAHRERVQRELASEPNDSDPLAGFRRCRKAIRGRPASASAFTVLLARLDRLQMMLNNPGWTLAVFLLLASTALAVDYPIALLVHPRTAGRFHTQSVAEIDGPHMYHPDTDLIVLEPDGTERMLVENNVLDWCRSLDGKSIYYAQVGKDSEGTWCDLFLIPVAGGTPLKLTDGKNDWSGPTGYYKAGTKRYVWNTSPCPTPDGLTFTSDRSGVMSPGEAYRAFQLFRLLDGHVEKTAGHMNLGGAAHPVLGPNGRIFWSSGEQQGGRATNGNAWAIFSSHPDGSEFGPEISAIPASVPIHFQTITGDGTLVAQPYYDMRSPYGSFLACPTDEPGPFKPPTLFGDPLRQNNPPIKFGYYPDTDRLRQGNFLRFSYQRRNAYNPVPWSHSNDVENVGPDGTQYGMVAHPQAIPGNGIMLTWTGNKGDMLMDTGVYALPDIRREYVKPQDMMLIVDKPDRHEWAAAPLVPWTAIYPSPPPKLERKLAADLPDCSPYAKIGSSNVRRLEFTQPWLPELTGPAADADQFVPYADHSKAKWIRVVHFNPTQDYKFADRLNNGPSTGERNNSEGFSSAFNERAGFYDQLIPIEDDGSIAAYIPADQPCTFQALDEKFQALSTAKTWHIFRPGEERVDCGGCHAHFSPEPRPFKDSIAGRPNYAALWLKQVRFVEYYRDIKPIDDRLGLGLGDRPWYGHHDKPETQAYVSILNTVDDDPRLTPAEARLLRESQDTGYLANGTINGTRILPSHGVGALADIVPPTLCAKFYAAYFLIGADDPHTGLKEGSLSVKSTEAMLGRAAGEELADLGVRTGDVWRFNGKAEGTVTITIRDNQRVTFPGLESEDGNITRLIRTVAEKMPDPLPPPDDRDLQIAALQRQVTELQAGKAADAATIAELRSRIAGLEARIVAGSAAADAVKAALNQP